LVPIGAPAALRRVLDAQHAVLRGAPEDRDEFVVAERLLDVIERALVHGLHRGLERGLRGHEDHGRVRIVCARRRENVDAAHLRHAHVGQHDVRRELWNLLEARLATERDMRCKPLIAQENLERLENS